MAERLSAVLEVIYLVFNEGYAATAGEHWIRPALCEHALRLGRILVALMPSEVTPALPNVMFPDELEMEMPVEVAKVNGAVQVRPAAAIVAEAEWEVLDVR